MPKYCPLCESEFNDTVKSCPKDKKPLLDKAPPEAHNYFVDMYAAADEIEAERIISYLLSIGIPARESIAGLSQMPVVSDMRYIVSVQRSKINEAKDAINQARHDQIISKDGSFV